jgi:hypothetical protein
VGAQNLIFGEYRMPARRNSAGFYDARDKKPGERVEGVLHRGPLPAEGAKPATKRGFRGSGLPRGAIWGLTLAALVTVGWACRPRRGSSA